MALPTTTNVAEYLSQRFGVTVTAGDSSIAQMLNSAIDELGNRTGYNPFVAGSAQAKVFDSPTRSPMVIKLPNSIASLTSLVVAGETWTENVDFSIEPQGTSPAEYIKLYRVPATLVRSVTITAKWGYCEAADLPAAIFDALVELAAGKILSAIVAGAVASSGESWTDGDITQRNASASSGGMAGSDTSAAGPGLIASAYKQFGQYTRSVAWVG